MAQISQALAAAPAPLAETSHNPVYVCERRERFVERGREREGGEEERKREREKEREREREREGGRERTLNKATLLSVFRCTWIARSAFIFGGSDSNTLASSTTQTYTHTHTYTHKQENDHFRIKRNMAGI